MATRQTITPWALRTEALRVSKNHVRRILREKGIRESSFKASQLSAMARQWFELNREELIGQALGSLAWSRLCAELKTFARKAEAEKSMASIVQISGPKVEAL